GLHYDRRHPIAGRGGIWHQKDLLLWMRVGAALWEEQALVGDLPVKDAVGGWLDLVYARRYERLPASTCVQGRPVGGGVDAYREPCYDRDVPGDQRSGHTGGYLQPASRRGARSDHGHGLVAWNERTSREEDGRSLVHRSQTLRIAAVENGDDRVSLIRPALDVLGGRLQRIGLARRGHESGWHEPVPYVQGAARLDHLGRDLAPAHAPRTGLEQRHQGGSLLGAGSLHAASVRG